MECASIQRDASSIAWCPVSSMSSLDTGSSSPPCNPIYLMASVHQEMDNNFNSSSQIEILNTSPSSIQTKSNQKTIVPTYGSGISKLSFTALTWGQQTNPTNTMPLGLIAGGMEDGSISFWNPYHLINGQHNKALLGQYSDYHQQKITAMQFNPSIAQHTFLATCDVGEKLYVWDLTNPNKPVAQQPPTGKRRNSDNNQSSYPKYATAVAWNNNVSYILAVSNCLGQTAIYDLRNKKVALTFESKNIDKAQSISWNPNKARQLAVCYVKGEAEIWDLKQPKSPKMYLRDEQYGHTRSILDLSWNQADHNLLLTSGDDCVGNIWNGNSGRLIHQIPFGDDPKLKVEWNNLRPGLLATMSTQNISLYNINHLGDAYCPKWLNANCGVDFGFGGKVVSFGTEYIISTSSSSTNLRSDPPKPVKKKLRIPPNITVDYLPKSEAMMARAKQFKKTLDSLSTVDDLEAFINTKLMTLQRLKATVSTSAAKKAKTQTENEDSDKDILSELGINDSDDEEEEEEEKEKEKEAAPGAQNIEGDITGAEIDFEIKVWEMIQLFFNETDCKDDIIKYLGFEKKELIRKKQEMEQKQPPTQTQAAQPSKNDRPSPPSSKPSPLEIESEAEDTDDDDFFNNLSAKPVIVSKEPGTEEAEVKAVTEPITASPKSKDKPKSASKRFERPSMTDQDVREAIITGNYGLAIELSLNAGNIADALVFAYYARDSDLWQNVTKAYFKQHSQQFIANTFCFIAQNDYLNLVQTSDVNQWRETLAILLTFTEGETLNELCNILGQRLIDGADHALLEGAIACFLCSHNIASLISLWTVCDAVKPTDLVLNSCITKALIYVNTPFVQQSLSQQPSSYSQGQRALSSIFCKYANLLANQGSLEIASTFLQFIDQKLKKPSGAKRVNDEQIRKLRSRIETSQKPDYKPSYQSPAKPYNAEPAMKPRRTSLGTRGTRPTRPTRGPQKRRSAGNAAPIATSNNKVVGSPSTGPQRARRSPVMRGRGPPSKTRGPPPPDMSARGPQRKSGGPMTKPPMRGNRGNPAPIRGNPQPQPSSNAPVSSSLPPNRARTMPKRSGRGPPPHRGPRVPPSSASSGGGGTVQNAPQQSNPPPRKRAMPGQHKKMPPANTPRSRGPGGAQGGMNGNAPSSQQTSMPPSRNMRPQRGNRPKPNQMRGRGSTRMPPVSNQNQPMTQAPVATSAQAAMPSRPMRDRRQRIPPRGRGRPPRPQQQVQEVQPQPRQPQPMADKPVVGGYSASAASSGSGFFGQTNLLDDEERAPLPDNAMDSLESVKGYLSGIISDDNIMSPLSITEQKTLKTQSGKLAKDLNDLISNNKMSYYAYSSLLEIFNSLQSRQYESAMKQITEFTKSCKSNKQEKFATHRKWVMAFQSIIRIAKQYNI